MRNKDNRSRTFKLLSAGLLTLATVLLLALAIKRAALPYNENGIYFDAQSMTTHDEGAVAAYGFQALVFCIPAVILWVSILRKPKANKMRKP